MKINELSLGQEIHYNGEMIVMRDAAQERLHQLKVKDLPLPIDLQDRVVFYAGPAKMIENKPGAIGPTTAARMDRFLEMLFEQGVIATIGKGKRSSLASRLCRQFRRPYFVAPSGAAAALADRIIMIEVLACEDLGTEAIYRIETKDFPLIVAIDQQGCDLFEEILRR